MGRPTPELFAAALRVLGYLYRTRHIGLRYEASKQALEGFSDSDWAVKHSTSGHTFSLGSATISWTSKKQPSVALSSCEAEIMAGSEAAKEAIYLSAFLPELGFDMSEPPPLKMDNKSAIDLAYNPEHHARTKHIDRRHYFIRECVENGRLRVPFVATADNIADFFTKPLMGKDFFRLRDKVMHVAPASSPAMLARKRRSKHWSKTVFAVDLLKGGRSEAIKYLNSMKTDYLHTLKHGADDAHEVGASHYSSRGPIWQQFIDETAH